MSLGHVGVLLELPSWKLDLTASSGTLSGTESRFHEVISQLGESLVSTRAAKKTILVRPLFTATARKVSECRHSPNSRKARCAYW